MPEAISSLLADCSSMVAAMDWTLSVMLPTFFTISRMSCRVSFERFTRALSWVEASLLSARAA